jgi:DNA-binding GntR family transcriptional regulator
MTIIKKTYKDQVIDFVYDLILQGKLNPGDQIKESHLATEMGISRAPIREALKELIASGIIQYKTHVGNFIYNPSSKEIIDDYTTRGVLEGFAVSQIANEITNEEIDEFFTMTEIMGMYAKKGNNKKVIDLGDEFHNSLVFRNKNLQLINFCNSLSLKLHILFYKNWGKLYSASEIEERHKSIVLTLKEKNKDKIEKVIREHYIETGEKIAKLNKK